MQRLAVLLAASLLLLAPAGRGAGLPRPRIYRPPTKQSTAVHSQSVGGASGATTCAGLPNNGDAPPNTSGWASSCTGKLGTLCKAPCVGDGVRGAVVAACTPHGWSSPVGACRIVETAASHEGAATAKGALGPAPVCPVNKNASDTFCYRDPSVCLGLPAGANPPNANSNPWPMRAVTDDGNDIWTDCRSGYVGGMFASCVDGQWSSVSGRCYRDPNWCWAPPSNMSLAHMGEWPQYFATPHGDYTQARCYDNDDTTTQYHLDIVSTCFQGNWTNPMGTCAPDPRTCWGTPPNNPAGPNSLDWPTTQTYDCGELIRATCKTGYVGGVMAMCNPNNANTGLFGQPWGACFHPNATAPATCSRRPPGKMPPNALQWESGNCDNSNGGFCYAQCRSGHLGHVVAQCVNGQWLAPQGMCFRNYRNCVAQPSFIPANARGWEQCNTNLGRACKAICAPGFVGNPVPASFCMKGRWQRIQGACVPDPTICPKMPPFLPEGAEKWSEWCDHREGSLCSASCKPGWQGSPVSICSKGQWQAAQGACVPDPKPCPTNPPFVPPNTNGWKTSWDGCPNGEGARCEAMCLQGFVGTVVSYCSGGKWSAAAGACLPDTSLCVGTPDDVNGTDGWSWQNCYNTEGGFCTADCSEPTVGTPMSFCSQGVWSTPVGKCWQSTGATCDALPPALPGNAKAFNWPDGCAATPEGLMCQAACEDGYVGSFFSVCGSGGIWGPLVGSCWKASQWCYDHPVGSTGNRSLDWEVADVFPDGQALETTCKPGYTGGYRALCAAGQWRALSGGCYDVNTLSASTCVGPPSAASVPAHAQLTEACSSGITFAQGDACFAQCDSGYTGSPVFYCVDGTWVPGPAPNDCWASTTTCDAATLPALPGNATYWNCPSSGLVAEGTLCTAACSNEAPYGQPLTVCRNGAFTPVVGPVCQPAPPRCYEPPPVLPDNATEWACERPPTVEGDHCHARCAYGFAGQPTAYCHNGVWGPTYGACLPEVACFGDPTVPLPDGTYSWWCSDITWESDICVAGRNDYMIGQPYSQCVNGSWQPVVYSTSQDPSFCEGTPSNLQPDGSFWATPANTEAWACSLTEHGQYCTARCKNLQGTLRGYYFSQCVNGSYTQPFAGGSGCHIAVTTGCAKGPAQSPGVYANDWPDCTNSLDGQMCVADCIQDYAGAVVSICQGNGVWSAPFGNCARHNYKCFNTPPNPPANKSYDWPSLGDPKYIGDIIVARCSDEYVGHVTSQCLGGNQWSEPVGTCYYRPSDCVGVPSVAPANANEWKRYLNYRFSDGDVLETGCIDGFSGGYVAICSRGTWTVTGNCTLNPSVCQPPANPPGPNAQDWPTDAANWWDGSYSHGTTLRASCLTDFLGEIHTTCLMGTWTPRAGACWKPASTCNGVPSFLPGNFGLDWPRNTGDSWLPIAAGGFKSSACRSGYKREVVAVCVGSNTWKDPACVSSAECLWPPSGPLRDACPGLEYVAVAGDTLSSIAATICQDDLLTAVLPANPQITGSTICPGDSVCCPHLSSSGGGGGSTPCPALPPPPSNSSWAASGAGAADGTRINATCALGYAGAPYATCSSGSWTVSGSCTPAAPATYACATPVDNARFWGGGYNGGTAADMLPALTNIVSATVCRENCLFNTACKQWIYKKDTKGCYRNTVAYTGATTIGQTNFISGTCGYVCSVQPWPATGVTWNACAGQALNSRCNGTCSGSGSIVSSTCGLNGWSAASASCGATTCSGVPPMVPANAAWDTNCGGATNGSRCTATCAAGFAGAPYVTCLGSSWSAVSGNCTAIPPATYACATPMNNTRFWGGGYLTGASGDMLPAQTNVSTYNICLNTCLGDTTCKQWVYKRDTKGCYRNTVAYTGGTGGQTNYISGTCSYVCSVQPPPADRVVWPSCAGKALGQACNGTCLSGASGTPYSICGTAGWSIAAPCV